MEYTICKSGAITGLALSPDELELVNQQSLRPLAAEEVFAFKVTMCDTLVDRDYESFSEAALEELSKLFVGRPVICDHKWSTNTQVARLYFAEVVDGESCKRLIGHCYVPRLTSTEAFIAEIETGIKREVSVGCSMGKRICSICGADRLNGGACGHDAGRSYDGKLCSFELSEALDAYELSFVAVPAQRQAGVTKSRQGVLPKNNPMRLAMAFWGLSEIEKE